MHYTGGELQQKKIRLLFICAGTAAKQSSANQHLSAVPQVREFKLLCRGACRAAKIHAL